MANSMFNGGMLMNKTMRLSVLASAALLSLSLGASTQAQQGMTFFVTSASPGKGGDFGGLAGADAHCQRLAQAAGAGTRTWRAYLSTQGAGAVNAKDRIGAGPWMNAKGQVVAKDVNDLHSPPCTRTRATALDEKGNPIPGRGATPNKHDAVTGSQMNGTA